MDKQKIIGRCMTKLGMTKEETQWVADNIYRYYMPDWSEWTWRQTDQCLRDTLTFKK